MQRLNTLDAEFLYLEDASEPMHIAALCIFEGPIPTRGQMLGLCDEMVERFPCYRQKLLARSLGLRAPQWIDDPHLELDYHLRFTALPEPHDDQALSVLMGRLMSQLLDRSRPLWECWIVDGLADGRWAMITKIHHALVDGISGASMLAAWFDGQQVPGTSPAHGPKQHARVEPNSASTWEQVRELAKGVGKLAHGLRLTRRTSLQGSIGQHRSYAFASASMDDVQRIRAAFGGTVNDVLLTALAAGYRRLLMLRGDDVNAAPLRTLVPVSTRTVVQPGMNGNRLSALLCELPTHISDPVQRLRAVHAQTQELKRGSRMANATAWIIQLGELVPDFLLVGLSRLAVRVMHRFPQRSVATVTTLVPGPKHELSCLGRRLLAYYPYVPILQGMRVATAILTYDGAVGFGVTSDYDSVPEADVLTQAITNDLAELAQRADTHSAQTAGRLEAARAVP